MTDIRPEIGAELNGPGRRYYDDVVLDNLMESMLELTAAVWTYHDRASVLEAVIGELLAESHGRPDVRQLVELHRPTAEEQARRRVEREQLVTQVFRSFARRPTSGSTEAGMGRQAGAAAQSGTAMRSGDEA